MANSKISALTASTTPLAGTEVLPIVQSSATKQVSVANLTAGRAVSASSFTASGDFQTTGDQFFFSSNGGGVAAGHLYSGSTGKVQTWVGTNAITETTGADFKNLVGNFIPNVAGKGINFTANTPAAGMTSQLLNWYEEGTWTPVVAAGSISGTNLVYTGTYTRIGRAVTITFRANSSSSSNDVVVGSYVVFSGLPFTASVGGTSFTSTEDIDFKRGGEMGVNNGSASLELGACGANPGTSTIYGSLTYIV